MRTADEYAAKAEECLEVIEKPGFSRGGSFDRSYYLKRAHVFAMLSVAAASKTLRGFGSGD